jgi:hypothetical protein
MVDAGPFSGLCGLPGRALCDFSSALHHFKPLGAFFCNFGEAGFTDYGDMIRIA